jgi:hypothetical protein
MTKQQDSGAVRYGDEAYMRDGVSEHSHLAAAGRTIGTPGFKDHAPDKPARITASYRVRLDNLIAREAREVARLERRVQEVKATDPERAKARTVKLQRTRILLFRLRRERDALQ